MPLARGSYVCGTEVLILLVNVKFENLVLTQLSGNVYVCLIQLGYVSLFHGSVLWNLNKDHVLPMKMLSPKLRCVV